MTAVDPITDYDQLERALGKLAMVSPNEHARGIAALHRIREREMNPPEGTPDPRLTEAETLVRELDKALATMAQEVVGLEAQLIEMREIDEMNARGELELRAEVAYLRQSAIIPAPCIPWAEIGADLQESWREHAEKEMS